MQKASAHAIVTRDGSGGFSAEITVVMPPQLNLQTNFISKLVQYLDENCGSLSIIDVTHYEWIDDELRKDLIDFDTTDPIHVSFYVSDIRKHEHRIFIGPSDNNITVTKSVFLNTLENFMREIEYEGYKYNLMGDDVEYENISLQELKKIVM